MRRKNPYRLSTVIAIIVSLVICIAILSFLGVRLSWFVDGMGEWRLPWLDNWDPWEGIFNSDD